MHVERVPEKSHEKRNPIKSNQLLTIEPNQVQL